MTLNDTILIENCSSGISIDTAPSIDMSHHPVNSGTMISVLEQKLDELTRQVEILQNENRILSEYIFKDTIVPKQTITDPPNFI